MTITNSSTRLVAAVAGVAVALALVMGAFAAAPAQAAALSQSQINAIVSLLQSFGADAATVANVTASLNGQATPGTGGTGTGGACPALSRDLQQGSTGADVLALQKFLNGSADTMVAASGAGSPGNETSTFGPATKAAVIKFQTKYSITPVAGYVGAKTRAQITAVCGGGGGVVVPTGPGLSIMAAAQPANALAPEGAARVPFTTFTLANNTSAPVTVTSVTVQRTGFGVDNNFGGIVLIDQNGLQVGISHTLNSNHQTNIGDNFTIGAGQSMTFTVAGNIADQNNANGGQIVSLQVVAVNTSVPVSGSLPINGASHTINTNLTLGSVSTSTSSFDPGTTQQKSIGDTGIRFTGIRLTANSAEDLKFYSIRWRQVGTASAIDIGNIMTVVNGTSYPTTLDASGRYYTSTFPGGISITKGNSVDVYVQGDIVGSNASSRNVDFDIDKNTDVYFVGQTYGYGVTFSASCNGSICTNSPWLNGYVTSIQGGSATVIQNATSVASANVPVGVNGTVLGGFQTNFSGEAVTVSSLIFAVSTSSTSYSALQTVSLVDQNGLVIAGPVDESTASNSTGTLTFSDSVTFPTGLHTWTLKGKVASAAANGSTIVLSTTANSTNWVSATGQTTGNSVSLPGTVVTMNTMTVKGATLTITASPSPAAQSTVTGTGVELANVQLDASQSGEDIRLNSLPLSFTGSLTMSTLNTCQLWNGSTALNGAVNGSNIVNSVSSNGGTAGTDGGNTATTFNFDNSLVISKGTVVTLKLKCNIASSGSGTLGVGVDSGFTYSAVGVQSGNSLGSSALTITPGFSGTQTVSNTGGTFTAAVDSSSPSYSLVAAGSTGVTVGVIKLHAASEGVNVTKLGLKLTNSGNSGSNANGGSTNSGVSDLTQVSIYNGSTLVGYLTFTGTTANATSTLLTPVMVAKDADVYLTVKADLASIGASSLGGVGDVVKVDPNNAEGSGVNSGQTIKVNATGNVAGIQMHKSYPTVAPGSVSCNSGTSCQGTSQVLKRFNITANAAGSVSLYQIAVALATSSATVTNLQLFASDSSCSNPVNVPNTTGGQFGGTAALGGLQDSGTPTVSFIQTTPLNFSGTVCFTLKGNVVPSTSTWSVSATILGDAATSTQLAGTNANIATAVGRTQSASLGYATSTSNKNFVWSDNASTTAAINDVDWFDGFYVPGLSSSGF